MRDWPKVGGLEEDIPTGPLVDDPASSRATLTYAPRSRVLLRPPMPHGQWLIFMTGGLRQGLSTVCHDGQPAKIFLRPPRPNLIVLLKRV